MHQQMKADKVESLGSTVVILWLLQMQILLYIGIYQ